MAKIHPLAVVSPEAQIGLDVVIGPFCIIEAGVTIGDGCVLDSHAILKTGTTLGAENHLHAHVVVGDIPQHLRPTGPPGRVVIGTKNTFREFTTVHRAMQADRSTVIGDRNYMMGGAHVAHDCQLGSDIICANNAMLAGHVQVEDRAFISGLVGVHQFCRVGRLAMVGGMSRVVKDIPPFVTVDGSSHRIVGLNVVGLRRSGVTSEQIQQLKAAYRLIFRSGMLWTDVLKKLEVDFPTGPASHFLTFFKGSKRGITPERRVPGGATLKLPDEVAAESTQEGERVLRVRHG